MLVGARLGKEARHTGSVGKAFLQGLEESRALGGGPTPCASLHNPYLFFLAPNSQTPHISTETAP